MWQSLSDCVHCRYCRAGPRTFELGWLPSDAPTPSTTTAPPVTENDRLSAFPITRHFPLLPVARFFPRVTVVEDTR